MPTRDGYSQGIPCWVDLATTDPDSATAFYGPLFGWEFEPGFEGSEYHMAMRKGVPAAGLTKLSDPEMKPVWSTYLAVDDANDASNRIREAGGHITMGPDDVSSLGRLALAKDTTGADFGIWQAGTHFGAAIVNEHGGLNWNELVTDEPDSAISFYSRVFGHGSKTATTPGGREYYMLEVDDREIGGVIAPRKPGGASHWTVYFAVDDADETARVARSAGGEVHFGPINQPGVGTFVGLSDPEGADFTVIQLEAEID